MGRVTILGSGNAITEDGHENTHLLIEQGEQCVLVDCASSPIPRLKRAGVGFDRVTDLILTHFHPDHVAGVPGFLVESWLLGRKHPLNIYGLPHTIDRVEANMALYDWKKWPQFYPVIFHRLADQDMSLALGWPEMRIFTSQVKHMVPTIGLRIEFTLDNKTVAYSCDTEPCPQVVELARGADALVHEATGIGVGHSSAAQAATIARQAGVRSLYLIHYSAQPDALPGLLRDAREIFQGKVMLAVDGTPLEF